MIKLIFVLTLILPSFAQSKLPKSNFKKVISILKAKHEHRSVAKGRKLEFFTDYESEWVQAYARRWDTDQIHVYGGIAAISNGSEDTMALFICHELGHLYGGAPYSDSHNELSVEGRADYWATSECLPQIIPLLTHLEPSSYAHSHCKADLICGRVLDASMSVANFFANSSNDPHPDISTPDGHVVTQILKTHPPAQCRLDTYWAGFQHRQPPLCWMPSETGNFASGSHQVK